MIKEFLLVGFGGAIGSMLRYGCSVLCSIIEISNHWATLFVNSVGSFLIGIIIASCVSNNFYLFAAIGLCGGFTTFSTFSANVIEILQAGKYGLGLTYILALLILCIAFIMMGLYLGKSMKIN